MKPTYTIEQMQALNERKGGHWFSKDTMRYFGTRILYGTNVRNHLITKENNHDNTERRYTIRKFDTETYNVETVGEFLEYPTRGQAVSALERIIAELEKYHR